MRLDIALLGFGNVHRALVRLLLDRGERLLVERELELRVVGIATGRHGIVVDSDGIDLKRALKADDLGPLHRGPPISSAEDFIGAVPADVVLEATSVDPVSGEPASSWLASVLEQGMHAITANKGPVVHAYRRLADLARQRGLAFLFESAVMDGAPIFRMAARTLPGARIVAFRGILNSTTNFVLGLMTQGHGQEEAIGMAQELGIAERDPSLDIDGWDAALKTVALANVLMGADLRPDDVDRRGIRELGPGDAQEANSRGNAIKLVCRAEGDVGAVRVQVRPEEVPSDDLLAHVSGTSSAVSFRMDLLRELTVVQHESGVDTTGYGMLADLLTIAEGSA
ncbi:MAG: homoserine dehydrogenase [Anaerolineae bacterium]